MNLLKSTGIIAGMTLVSRIFGFVRDIMLARILGAGAAADAWQLAFQLPNIFRRLFAEGAFSAAFVPLFNRKMEMDEDRTAAQTFVIEVLSVFVPLLLVFSAVMMLAMPGIIWLIDDFGRGGRTGDFSISLARITFPYLGLISVTTLFAAILNSLSRFAAAAAAPIILNICMITALLVALLVNDGNDPRQTAYFLAIAVASAGLAQMLWLYYWARKTGFRFPLKMPRFNADVKELGILILPAVFGAGIYQISRFIDLFFLGRLPEGSFVYLAMADRLNQLPLGIIGIALGTAILPALSRYIACNEDDEAQRLQSNAIELAMLLTFPAAVALFFTGSAFVRVFMQAGAFTPEDAAITGTLVSGLVIGLPAYVLVKVLTPNFFARRDTRTPVYTAALSLLVTVAINLLLVPRMGVLSLAVAGAIGAWVNTLLLYSLLARRGLFVLPRRVAGRLGRIMLACVPMAAALWYAMQMGDPWFGGTTWERLSSILAVVVVGALTFIPSAFVLGVLDIAAVQRLMRRQT